VASTKLVAVRVDRNGFCDRFVCCILRSTISIFCGHPSTFIRTRLHGLSSWRCADSCTFTTSWPLFDSFCCLWTVYTPFCPFLRSTSASATMSALMEEKSGSPEDDGQPIQSPQTEKVDQSTGAPLPAPAQHLVMRDGVRLHPQPTSDPLDPLNWSSFQKHSILAIIMLKSVASLQPPALSRLLLTTSQILLVHLPDHNHSRQLSGTAGTVQYFLFPSELDSRYSSTRSGCWSSNIFIPR